MTAACSTVPYYSAVDSICTEFYMSYVFISGLFEKFNRITVLDNTDPTVPVTRDLSDTVDLHKSRQSNQMIIHSLRK